MLSAADQNGVLTGTVPIGFADVTDGTSQVILASEQVVAGIGGTQNGRAAYRYAPNAFPSSMPASWPTWQQVFAWGTNCSNSTVSSTRVGRKWHRGLPGQTAFNTLLPPNVWLPNCSNHCPDGCDSDGPGLYAARSHHTGGVQVLLVDGSVRFVAEQLDIQLWYRLGARNDGATLGEF